MKEIKFRYVWKNRKDNHLEIEYYTLDTIQKKNIYNRYSPLDWDIIARDLYTGIKDKNDKEIYKGDIIHTYVRAKNKENGKIIEPYDNREVVKWGVWQDDEYGYTINTWILGDNDYLRVSNKYKNPYWDAIEEKYDVIGNIYQNPELMENK